MSVDTAAHVDVTSGHPVGPVAYRYPGSPPFRDTDLDRRLFTGRSGETDIVLHSILSSNLFVLYALSGLGKTSLLNAGVMPELRARGHWPVSVRLNDPGRDPVALVRDQIESAAEADPGIDLQVDPTAVGATQPESLWDLFAPLEVWRGNQLQQLVVVLDQFEELFTLGWTATDRARFIAQFGEVVRGHRSRAQHAVDPGQEGVGLPPPAVKFVIVIREDSLGELEALAADVPQILRSRFRLGPLDPAQAEAAIREPALIDDGRLQSQRFSYTPAACKEILDFLRTTTERGTVVEGSTVDPSQLQIVCQYVERAIVPTKRPASPDETVAIDAPDLGGRSGLQRVLGDFYRRTLDSVPVSEQRAVRRLCERGLVNVAGRRLSLEEGEIATTYGVSHVMLDHLVDARLLRADPRVGSVYYELAHDTLVAPILAFRDEERARRVRRTRRIAIAAGAVLAVVLVAALVYVLASSTTSDEVRARPLAAGETVDTVLDEPGDMLLFSLDPSSVPLVAVVTPVDSGSESADATGPGPDVAVEYTTASGVTRLVDEAGIGAPERIVVPPTEADGGGGELRVAASGGAVGSLEISLAEVAVTELTGDDAIGGAIAAPGDVSVYAGDAEAGARIAIDVSPVPVSESPVGGEQPAKDLDVRLELIDPSGAGSVVDVNGSGQSEAAAGGGAAGRYYVVVRGYQTSTGAFTIVVRPDDFVLALDEPKPGRVDDASTVAEYVLDVSEPRTYAVEVVPDSKFDAALVVTDPAGETREVDRGGAGSTEFEVLGGVPGRYLIAVTGYESSAGGFTIEVRGVQDALVVDQPTDGRIDDASDQAEFVFELPEPGTYAVEVRPDAELDVVLQISDPFGDSRVVDNAPAGDADFDVVRGTDGRYVVGVSGYDTTTGGFEILVSAVDVATLRGGTVTASGIVAYEPVLAEDEIAEVRAEPGPAGVVEIRVIDLDGYAIDSDQADEGEAASLVLSSAVLADAQVVVRSDGDHTTTLEPIRARPITPGSSVSAAGSTAYEMPALDDELVELRADPESDESVELLAFDRDGYVTERAESRGPGEPASVVLSARIADGARVVVRSGGTYAVSLTTITPVPLAVGDTVSASGTAAYTVASDPDVIVELRAEPDSAAGLADIRLVDRDGYTVDGAESTEPGDAASIPLTGDVAEDVTVVVRSSAGSTLRAVVVPVVALPPGGTATATGTTAYALTLAADEAVEVRVVAAASGDVDVRIIDPSGYSIDHASAGPNEPVSVMVDGALAQTQVVLVMTTGEHTDTFVPIE